MSRPTVRQITRELNAHDQNPNQASTAYESQLTALAEAVNDITLRLERIERYLQINTTPSVAGPKLVNIPELLEKILLRLPTRDLLLAQRVSRTFNQVIHNSAAIQRALFFAPEPEPARLLETNVRLNPLLADEKSYMSIPLYHAKEESARLIDPVFIKGAGWTPEKLRVVEYKTGTSTVYDGSSDPVESVRLDITLGRLPGADCYGRVEDVGQSIYGSWRRMYMTQPPLRPTWYSAVYSGSGFAHVYEVPRWEFGELLSWKIRRSDGVDVVADENDL